MNGKYRLFLVLILFGISTCCFARTYNYKNTIDINDSIVFKIKVHYRIDSYVNNKSVNKQVFTLIDETIEKMQNEYPLENWSNYELTEFKKRLYFKVIDKFNDLNFRLIKIDIIILSP